MPSTICPSDSAKDAGSSVAVRSLTASHTVTTVGFCAIAPGSCCVTACRASEPATPRFVYAGDPAGRRAATRAGHDPFAGSLAPTPTVSDAPMATYLVPELTVAVGVALGVTVGLGEAVGPRVGDGCAAGAAEHAVTNDAQITVKTASSPFHIKQLLPSAHHRYNCLARTGPRGCVVSTGQADGPPRAEERRSSSLIRTAGRQLPTLLTLSLPSQ